MSAGPVVPQIVKRPPPFSCRIWTRLGRGGRRLLFGIAAVLAVSYVHNRNVRIHDHGVLTFRNVTLDLSESVPNPSTELWPAIRAISFEGLSGAAAVRQGSLQVGLPGSGAFQAKDARPLDLTVLRLRGADCPHATLEVSAGGVDYGFPDTCGLADGKLTAKQADGYDFGAPDLDLPQGPPPLDITWKRARTVKISLAAGPDTRGGKEILDLAATDDSVPVNRITGVLAAPVSLATGCLARCDPDIGERITLAAPNLRVLELSYAPDGHAVALTIDGLGTNSSIKRCSRRSSKPGENDGSSTPPAISCDEDLCKWPWGGLLADFAALLLALIAVVLA